MMVSMAGMVIKKVFPPTRFNFSTPFTVQFALLAAFSPLQFGVLGKVRVEKYLKREGNGLQTVIDEVNIFVKSFAEETRNFQFESLFRHGDHLAAAFVGRPGI